MRTPVPSAEAAEQKSLSSPALGYIAGIIDGEGTVSVMIKRGADKKGFWVQPLIKVDNTNKPLIMWLQQVCGGIVCAVKVRGWSKKQQWSWRLHGKEAVSLLAVLLPHLKVKREVARAVFTGAQGKYARTGRERWAAKVRALNLR
jgi:hypothetical protein